MGSVQEKPTRSAVDIDHQRQEVERAEFECAVQAHNASLDTDLEGYCKPTFDSILCWPATKPGETAELPCPDYIDNFYIHANASKRCMEDGTWFQRDNNTWSNYTSCVKTIIYPEDIVPRDHLDRIKLMYSIGYGVSLFALLVAIFIMIYFRRLHCPRNTIHLNLFTAFVLRALLSFLKDSLLVMHLGLPEDVILLSDGTYIFDETGTHWRCKLLFTTFHYVVLASSAWVFMEGLYLYILVTVTIFSERRFIKWCTLLGWAGPFLFLVPWVVIRATMEDKLCWNTHPTQAFFWILKGPQVAIAIINFIFFLNIIRVLFTKLVRTAPPRARKYRYRRLGKSTLVLIPILGVHYLITIGVPDNTNQVIETIKLYFEMFFNSFQGLLIACLFCFMNGEVQTELRKRYIRHKLRVNSGKFQNKYVATNTTQVRAAARSCPSCSPRHESRELNSSSGSGENNRTVERQKLRIYIQPMRYYRAQPPPPGPNDARPIMYTSKRNSYV